MPNNPLVGTGYDAYIGTRQKPGQTQVEYFSKDSGNAFANPNDLLRAVQPYAGNQIVDESNVFDVLARGYTPRDQALNQIKTDLNSFQEQTFNTEPANTKRASSSITDSIASEQGNYDTYFKEYNDLKAKMQALEKPNYQQSYNDLRQSSGIPGIENDFANNQKTIRELPYVNRMNMGNAGAATEGQLNADTAQKGIPLEIQQGNLLDRLKLAESFINNSLKFKEMDASASRQSLSDALNMVVETINLSRTHVNDLLNQQYRIEDKAENFAQQNNIQQRFYKLPGSDLVYDTKTQEALPFEEYKRRGGIGVEGAAFPDVQDVLPQTVQEERAIVADLATTYIDAGITLNDTLAAAQSKIAGSKIYQDKVRPPARSGGGGSSGSGSTSGGSSSNGFSAFPKTASANNIRNWLASNWHAKASQVPYYDAWGMAADIMRANGVDPSTPANDKLLWDVFRPGEYAQHNQGGSSNNSDLDPAMKAWLGIP